MGHRRVAEGAEALGGELTGVVLGAAIEVHRWLGPGLLESSYQACLCHELEERGLPFRRQVSLPLVYKGVRIDCGYRIDLIVSDSLIVEIKAVEQLIPIHDAQLLTYLRLTGIQLGLLINFNQRTLMSGVRRLALTSPPSATSATLR